MLEGSRLTVGTDRVTLEVGRLARVPDSEVVTERLAALATAIGVKRSEVVEV